MRVRFILFCIYFEVMANNGVLPELAEVDEDGTWEERFTRLEQLVTTLVAEVGRTTRVSSGPSPAGDGKCGSGRGGGWVRCWDIHA